MSVLQSLTTTPLNPNVSSIPQKLHESLTTSIAGSLHRSPGTLTINNGQVTSTVVTVAGTQTKTTSIEQFSQNLAQTLANVQGTITFDRGIAQTNLQTSLGNFTETVDFAQTIATVVQDRFNAVSGGIPFQNGQINVDVSTSLGAITGLIEFGNGALVSNLTTPFGFLFTSIDFKPEDEIKFPFGRYSGTVNFDDGLVIVDVQPTQAGGDIAVPINALSGTLQIENGQGSLRIPTPIGTSTAKLDLSALISRSIVNALQDTGTITVINGVATIETGNTQTILDLPAIVASLEFQQAISTLAQTQPGNTIAFDPITLINTLTPVSGALADNIDLTALSR